MLGIDETETLWVDTLIVATARRVAPDGNSRITKSDVEIIGCDWENDHWADYQKMAREILAANRLEGFERLALCFGIMSGRLTSGDMNTKRWELLRYDTSEGNPNVAWRLVCDRAESYLTYVLGRAAEYVL